jgi:hypothetical protein
MKTQNTLLKVLTVATLTAILTAAAAILDNSTGRVSAFNPQPDPPAFGAFGITHEQTARLNARVFVNDDRSTERLSPVVIEFDFHDTEDNLISSMVHTVAPGHAAFLDLNGGTLPIGGDGMRAEFQPSIKILDNPNGNRVQVIPSGEIFDNFGPDAGKSRMGLTTCNHNETLVRDNQKAKRVRR